MVSLFSFSVNRISPPPPVFSSFFASCCRAKRTLHEVPNYHTTNTKHQITLPFRSAFSYVSTSYFYFSLDQFFYTVVLCEQELIFLSTSHKNSSRLPRSQWTQPDQRPLYIPPGRLFPYD